MRLKTGLQIEIEMHIQLDAEEAYSMQTYIYTESKNHAIKSCYQLRDCECILR